MHTPVRCVIAQLTCSAYHRPYVHTGICLQTLQSLVIDRKPKRIDSFGELHLLPSNTIWHSTTAKSILQEDLFTVHHPLKIILYY